MRRNTDMTFLLPRKSEVKDCTSRDPSRESKSYFRRPSPSSNHSNTDTSPQTQQLSGPPPYPRQRQLSLPLLLRKDQALHPGPEAEGEEEGRINDKARSTAQKSLSSPSFVSRAVALTLLAPATRPIPGASAFY